MDTSKLTSRERQIRMYIRSFFLKATMRELLTGWLSSNQDGDTFRADCIRELIAERHAENSR